MIYSRIVGTGSYLPARVVTNAEFAERLETSDQWIRERTGIVQRHIAEPSQASSDLALEASRAALSAASVKSEEIDLIIVATSTPDFIFPSTACLLQAKLGIRNCPAFDVQAVCSGFVYAHATADNFIRAGTHRRALVVGSEVFSRILDWNDRGTCVLFGDGAGAVVLSAADRPGLHASVLHADGSQADILSVPGNVCGGRITGSPYLQMQGSQVFKFAVKVLDEVARETVAAAGADVAGCACCHCRHAGPGDGTGDERGFHREPRRPHDRLDARRDDLHHRQFPGGRALAGARMDQYVLGRRRALLRAHGARDVPGWRGARARRRIPGPR
jgi:3-oxoacyl-[acyl-carrier-protein] synthase-3